MAACLNHPTVDTSAVCARCAQPYCDSCLVDFMGQRFCGPCRDYRLYELQHPGGPGAVYSGTGTVDMGRWLGAGWNIISQDLMTWAIAMLLAGVIGLFSCYVCLGPLMCGMSMMAYRKMTYGTVEVGNVFDGFKRFLNAFLFMLILGVVSYAIGIGIQFGTSMLTLIDRGNQSLTVVALLMQWGISIPVQGLLRGLTFFSLPHIAARNANPIDALTASWEVVRRNPLMFCVAGLVFQIISSAGALALCLGIFVTAPLIVAANAQAYADHFGIEGWDRN
jgi:uncharacterized membrane protein